MTDRSALRARLSNAFQRNERKLIVAYLSVLAAATVFLAAAPVRRPLLHRAQKAAALWDDRWSRRLAEAEALVAAGALDSAVVHLERLELEFPARNVKHKRDAERERLLQALGRTYLALGSNERALINLRKLVAFDDRNFANHYELAQACIQAGEEAEAQLHLLHALAINPTHLPSLRSHVKLAYDVADYKTVVSAYESYLRAFMPQEVQASAGDSTFLLEMPADEYFHDLSVLFPKPAGWRGGLGFETGGLQLELERVTVLGALQIGKLGRDSVVFAPTAEPWITNPINAADSARAQASGLQVSAPAGGVERIILRARMRKPVDPALWAMVERSYRNLLNTDGLARARAASFLMRTVEAADSVKRPE